MFKFKYAFLTACGLLAPFSANADINISVIAPTNGDFKYYSEELINGAKIAVDEINESGGLLSKKVNLVQIDDPCDATLSLTTAQMIAVNRDEDRKMHMVVGPICSAEAPQIANLFAEAGIFQVRPLGSSRNLFAQKSPSLFELVGYVEQQAVDFFKFYNDKLKDKKVVVVYNGKNTEMTAVAQEIQNQFLKADMGGKSVAVDSAVALGDAAQIAAEVAKEKPEVVFVMENAEVTSRLVEILKADHKDLDVFVNRYWSGYKFPKRTGNQSEGVYVLSLPSLNDNPNFVEHLVKLRLWGIDPEGLMAYGYLSVKLWQEGVEDAHSFDAAAIGEKLDKQVLPVGWGNILYDSGVPEKSLKYSIYRIEKGEYVHIY